MIEFKGEQVEVMELSKQYGIPWSTINNRYLAGYRDADLVVKRLNPIAYCGEETTLVEIAAKHQIPYSLIKERWSNGIRDGRLIEKSHLGIGSENAATKLDTRKVIEIKTLLITTDLKQGEIAKMYGVDQSHISDIKRGKRWGKVKINIEELIF